MRRTAFCNVACSAAFLLFGAAGTLPAQVPNGGAPSQQTNPAANPTGPAQPNMASRPDSMDPNAQVTSTKVDDKKFIKDAAVGGLTEVQLGQLAAQKASNADVKQFAQKMVDDHTKANDKLKEVASQENIPVPATLDSKHQARIDKLSKLSGDQFDKAYLKDQLKDHQTDVREFNAEAQNGSDPKVKSFAANILPTLQQHLEMVKNLNKTDKK